MHKLLLSLIMILLLIILLLTISILTILLWSAIILLRTPLKNALKEKKCTVRNDGKPVKNDSPKAEVNPKSQGKNRQEKCVPQQNEYEEENCEVVLTDNDQYNASDEFCNTRETGEQEDQSLSVMECMPKNISSFQDRTPIDIINGDIRLKAINNTSKKQFGAKSLFIEAPDGKIVICKISKKIYYVIPAKKKISTKDCEVGDIGVCFSTNLQLLDGKQYQIIKVNKCCKMVMEEDGYYTLAEKGELMLEEVRY